MYCKTENHGNVVAAHSNSQAMGKGMGHKAADIPAYLCADCHDLYDGRRPSTATATEKYQMWCSAALLSMRWALENHPKVFA